MQKANKSALVSFFIFSILLFMGCSNEKDRQNNTTTSTRKVKDVKIIATLGKEGWNKIPDFCKNGANIFRINGSHVKNKEQFEEILKNVQSTILNNPECINTEVMYDTQGPEIRTRIIASEQQENVHYTIKAGDKIIIHTNLEDEDIRFAHDIERINNESKTIHIGVNYGEFINDVKIGDLITIESREIYAQVEDIDSEKGTIKLNITEINTEEDEYVLTDRRHINLLGGDVSQPTLTEMDKEYMKMSAIAGVKYYAISFVRNANDITETRNLIAESLKQNTEPTSNNSAIDINRIKIIAKIETKQGLDNIDEIVQAADGAMVARGDLSSEIPVEEVRYAKEKIIETCNKYNKFSIFATNVLESLMQRHIPSSNDIDAIVSALKLNVDALMLSNETAVNVRANNAIKEMKKQIEYFKNKYSNQESF